MKQEISRETISALRAQAAEDALYLRAASGVIGPPIEGIPITEENGKFYIDLDVPAFSKGERSLIQQIVEKSEAGTWVRDRLKHEIRIWDGEAWFTVTEELLRKTVLNYGLNRSPMEPEDLATLKGVVQTHEEEAERLALRQLLAERQHDE